MADAKKKTEIALPTLDTPLDGAECGGAVRTYKAQIDRFVILHQLGVGGMGAVFAAYDEKLDRKVALKLLHMQGASQDRQQQRTLREAKALARVNHPRVVSVYDVGESESQVFLAMEFIDGMTLRKWQSLGPRSWRDMLQMYLQAGAGLHAAHRAGVIHRDFKPENVLVGKDQMPRVVDFGIARLSDRQAEEAPTTGGPQAPSPERVTAEGAIIGTLGYISPEQYEGAAVDAKSDQWSFCAALYEALYGCLPFAGATLFEQAVSVRSQLRPPPADSQIPPEIFVILSRGLAPQPDARFSDMSVLLDNLAAEYEQSAAAGKLSRRTLIAAMAATAICVWLLAQYLLLRGVRLMPMVGFVSLGVIAMTLLAGYQHRATLRRNPFHRAMWALLLVAFIENFCVRVVFTIRGPLPSGVQIAIEMIVWLGTSLIMALTISRRVWWIVPFPFCIAILAIAREPAPLRLLLCAYPTMVGLLLGNWLWAARTNQSDQAAG